MKTPIGATCTVHYHDDNDSDSHSIWFISFGTIEDDAVCDSFGTPDDDIAFYCPGGEEELKQLMNRNNREDFWVEEYEICYSMDFDSYLGTDL